MNDVILAIKSIAHISVFFAACIRDQQLKEKKASSQPAPIHPAATIGEYP
jgi:hypothetical protein